MVRRDNREKAFVPLAQLEQSAASLLDVVHKGLYQRAKKNLEEHTYEAHSLEEARALQQEHGGFIKTMWCESPECEARMKEEAGMTSRCMPFQQEHLDDVCPICGKPAKKMIYWGVAYYAHVYHSVVETKAAAKTLFGFCRGFRLYYFILYNKSAALFVQGSGRFLWGLYMGLVPHGLEGGEAAADHVV